MGQLNHDAVDPPPISQLLTLIHRQKKSAPDDRLISLRCSWIHIYSGNGTNFVRASAELQRLQEVLEANESKEQIGHWAASKGVSWHFSPGRAPHFGRLWEAGVCAMKMTIRKIIGEQKLCHDELTTLLYEASAVLNSRPLTPLDTLAADGVAPLTPGHFLIGGPPAALASKPDTDFKSTYCKRWKLVERMTIDPWKRWRTEYLLLLQRRNKWNLPGRNLRPGDLVLSIIQIRFKGPGPWDVF